MIIISGPGFRGGEAGLGGAGLTFAQSGVHFLAGIMSIKFKETVEILTDVSKHIPWLRNIYSIYNRIGKTRNVQPVFLVLNAIIISTSTDRLIRLVSSSLTVWLMFYNLFSPDCGRLYTPSTKNSYFHGVKEKFSTAPWNAGVYKRSASNKYDLICGGTLIAPNLIISGKHYADNGIKFIMKRNCKKKNILCLHSRSILLGNRIVGKSYKGNSVLQNCRREIQKRLFNIGQRIYSDPRCKYTIYIYTHTHRRHVF